MMTEMPMGEAAKAVAFERRGAVAIASLSRPERRNSMDQALVDELRAGLIELDRDEGIRAIVLMGLPPGFCAGSDLKFISALSLEEMGRFEQECGDLGRLIGFISKPVVAAIERFAIGGGFTLATCCDVVVASRSSVWSLPEVPHGWLTPWGIKSLVARVGLVKARQLCYCLEALNAEGARELGVVDYCCDDGKALETAINVAEKLAGLPRAAVASTKRFFSGYLMQEAEAMDYEANRLFLENCREASAKATFEKFRARP